MARTAGSTNNTRTTNNTTSSSSRRGPGRPANVGRPRKDSNRTTTASTNGRRTNNNNQGGNNNQRRTTNNNNQGGNRRTTNNNNNNNQGGNNQGRNPVGRPRKNANTNTTRTTNTRSTSGGSSSQRGPGRPREVGRRAQMHNNNNTGSRTTRGSSSGGTNTGTRRTNNNNTNNNSRRSLSQFADVHHQDDMDGLQRRQQDQFKQKLHMNEQELYRTQKKHDDERTTTGTCSVVFGDCLGDTTQVLDEFKDVASHLTRNNGNNNNRTSLHSQQQRQFTNRSTNMNGGVILDDAHTETGACSPIYGECLNDDSQIAGELRRLGASSTSSSSSRPVHQIYSTSSIVYSASVMNPGGGGMGNERQKFDPTKEYSTASADSSLSQDNSSSSSSSQQQKQQQQQNQQQQQQNQQQQRHQQNPSSSSTSSSSPTSSSSSSPTSSSSQFKSTAYGTGNQNVSGVHGQQQTRSFSLLRHPHIDIDPFVGGVYHKHPTSNGLAQLRLFATNSSMSGDNNSPDAVHTSQQFSPTMSSPQDAQNAQRSRLPSNAQSRNTLNNGRNNNPTDSIFANGTSVVSSAPDASSQAQQDAQRQMIQKRMTTTAQDQPNQTNPSPTTPQQQRAPSISYRDMPMGSEAPTALFNLISDGPHANPPQPRQEPQQDQQHHRLGYGSTQYKNLNNPANGEFAIPGETQRF